MRRAKNVTQHLLQKEDFTQVFCTHSLLEGSLKSPRRCQCLAPRTAAPGTHWALGEGFTIMMSWLQMCPVRTELTFYFVGTLLHTEIPIAIFLFP